MNLNMSVNKWQKESRTVRMRFAFPAFCMLLSIISSATVLHSQSISLHAKFDTTAILIGEHTGFSIILEQPEGMHIRFPELSGALPDKIEILSAGSPDTTRTGENYLMIKTSWRVTSFEQGHHFVDEMPFTFMLDGEERILQTRPAGLEVLAPEIDPESGIFDIKAPFQVNRSAWDYLKWIMLVILCGALAWYLFRYLKGKKAALPSPENETQASDHAHLIAMRELRKLKSEELWQKGMLKEYYTRLTVIIRKYIEKRFAITAMEQTSSEIIGELHRKDGLPVEIIELLGQFFSLADLVKFAKARPVDEDHEVCLNTAFHFIKATFETGNSTGPGQGEEPRAARNQPGNNDLPDQTAILKNDLLNGRL
jgi:hypothetical protein